MKRDLLPAGALLALSLLACACTPPPAPAPPVQASVTVPPEKGDASAAVDAPLAVAPAAPPGPSLALGREFACALERVPGRVMCWGSNRKLQLGDGTQVSRATAGPVATITDAVEVSAAGEHACARTASEEVFCWGDGAHVARVSGVRNVARVVVEGMRTCAIDRAGLVWCWGLERWLPDPHNKGGLTTGPSHAEPTMINGLAGVVDLALGWNHACARDSRGAVRCFGGSTHGELGNAAVMGRDYVVPPVDVDGLRGTRAIGAGSDYTCALRDDHRVTCWGGNYRGAIFNGSEPGHATPAQIAGIESAVTLTVADDHACALLADSTVRCFGNNDGGKLGSADPSPVARTVVGLSDAIEVAVGPEASCARRRSGAVVCWGRNESGQLGNGEMPGVSAPVRIEGISDATDAALSDYTTCVLRASGGVTCIGSPGGYTERPSRVDIPALGHAVQITAAEYYTCALSREGPVACWGLLDKEPPLMGAVGSSQVTLTPAIAKLPPARMLTAGGAGTCALLRSGQLTCWGDQGAQTRAPTPVSPPIRDVVEIEQGSLWGCAVQGSGHVACWGFGYGTEYDKRSRSMSPVVVPGLEGIRHVSVGTNHACAIRASGGVVCFGESSDMGLGSSDGLQEIKGISDAVQVSAGMAHTCVVTRSGEVWCWGWNDSGELGTPGARSAIPMRVPAVSGAVKVAVGAHHSCAIDASHGITCWGNNSEGQITFTIPKQRPTPVTVLGLGPAAAR